jgi:hypothetical protein
MDRLARDLKEVVFDPAVIEKKITIAPWKDVAPLDEEQANKILLDVAAGASLNKAASDNNTSVTRIVRFRFANKAFGEAMNQAIEIRNMLLEDKAFELAYHGQESTVTKGTGDNKIKTTNIDYPGNPLLQFLLKAEQPEKYGVERQDIRTGPLEAPPDIIRSERDRAQITKRIEERRQARELEAIAVAGEVNPDTPQEIDMNDFR